MFLRDLQTTKRRLFAIGRLTRLGIKIQSSLLTVCAYFKFDVSTLAQRDRFESCFAIGRGYRSALAGHLMPFVVTLGIRTANAARVLSTSRARIVVRSDAGGLNAARCQRIRQIQCPSIYGNRVDAADEIVGMHLTWPLEYRICVFQSSHQKWIVVKIQSPVESDCRCLVGRFSRSRKRITKNERRC